MSKHGLGPVIALFLSTFPEKSRRFTEALQQQDWDALEVASHQLKGSAGGYGFPDLTELAATVEDCLQTEEIDARDVDVQDVEAAVVALVTTLDSHFAFRD